MGFVSGIRTRSGNARATGTARGPVGRGPALLLALATLALLLLLSPFAATAFAQGGHIQGTVTDAGSTPLQGITVTAYAYDFSFGSWSYAADTSTDAAGTYDLGGLASTYFVVEFSDPMGTYISEYYDNQSSWDYAWWLWLDPDATTSGIDASLSRPCSISGVVTSAKTGDPLANVLVDLYRPSPWGGWENPTSVLTDDAGAYSLVGLSPGEYRLGFWPTDGLHLLEYYENAATVDLATSLYPADGEALTGYDAALDQHSSISGTVTDVYGTAIVTSYIELYQSDGSGGWSYLTYAYGDTSGDYTFTGLTAGDYRVGFFDLHGRVHRRVLRQRRDARRGDRRSRSPAARARHRHRRSAVGVRPHRRDGAQHRRRRHRRHLRRGLSLQARLGQLTSGSPTYRPAVTARTTSPGWPRDPTGSASATGTMVSTSASTTTTPPN